MYLRRCKVAFLNTDQIEEAHEVSNGNSFHNEGEAKIINTVLRCRIQYLLYFYVYVSYDNLDLEI